MKKMHIYILISACLFASACVGLQKNAIFGNSDGFRGVRWGLQMESPENENLHENEFIKKKGVFLRPGEDLSFGEAKMELIWYRPIKSRFYQVYMETHGAFNFAALMNELKTRLGPPKTANNSTNMYKWVSEDTEVFVRFYRLDQKITMTINPTGARWGEILQTGS